MNDLGTEKKQCFDDHENGRIKMTVLRYYALRYLFEPIVREETARCILLGDGNIYGYRPVKEVIVGGK